jgi:hypothetical protein
MKSTELGASTDGIGGKFNTNPIRGFLRTILLFLSLRVHFLKKGMNKTITMEDGQTFRIFRHVQIRTAAPKRPEGAFVVRFKPQNMTVDQNIRFSLLPMMIFMGFHGFREKYWCVNDETGLCQGVYAWQTVQDAENYSKSIAMRFMTNRSDPKSVSARVIDQSAHAYWLFDNQK